MDAIFPNAAPSQPQQLPQAGGIVPFDFDGAAVRVITRDGEPWFILADVCRVLGIGNPSMAATRLDDDEKGIILTDTLGGPQKTVVISESGLYRLVMRSDKPEAKRFQKWVTGEVLPTIRKTGSYGTDPMKALSDPATLRNLLTEYAGRVETLQAENAGLQVDRKALDRIARAEGSLGLQAAAKALNMQPKMFIAWLRVNGWVYQRHGASGLLGYSNRVQQGYLEHKVATIERPDGSEKMVEQVRITPRGLTHLAKLLGVPVVDPDQLI